MDQLIQNFFFFEYDLGFVKLIFINLSLVVTKNYNNMNTGLNLR